MGRKSTEEFLSKLEGGGTPLGKKQSVHLDRLFQRIDEIAAKYPLSEKIEDKQPDAAEKIQSSTYAVTNHDGPIAVITAPPTTIVVFVGFAQNPIHPSTSCTVTTVVTEYEGAQFVSADKSEWSDSEEEKM